MSWFITAYIIGQSTMIVSKPMTWTACQYGLQHYEEVVDVPKGRNWVLYCSNGWQA